MPLTHTRTFRVRHCECGVSGEVKYANYLRYMQETAFDASAAAGYDEARYVAMDRYWLIRETEIEYLRPLRYGDTVQITTWVADFRRVRSRRAYEFRAAESGDLVARASTDWVFLDLATGRPASIPAELVAAFHPAGLPPSTPRQRSFPPTPEPALGTCRFRRQVEWSDLDPAQHVNNATYLAYLEDCDLQMAEASHWPLTRMQSEGFIVAARRHLLEYRQPALFGDTLDVSTWISSIGPEGGDRHYLIKRATDGVLLVRALCQWHCIDMRTGKPLPLPCEYLTDLAGSLAGSPP